MALWFLVGAVSVFIIGLSPGLWFAARNRKTLADEDREKLHQLSLPWWIVSLVVIVPQITLMIVFIEFEVRGGVFEIIQPLLLAVGFSVIIIYQIARMRKLDLPAKFVYRQTAAFVIFILVLFIAFGMMSLGELNIWNNENYTSIFYSS